jgi:hypothetical protein
MPWFVAICGAGLLAASIAAGFYDRANLSGGAMVGGFILELIALYVAHKERLFWEGQDDDDRI